MGADGLKKFPEFLRRLWTKAAPEAALVATMLLLAVAAQAQSHASADFAQQYSVASSSSARLSAVMGAIGSRDAAQAAWMAADFGQEQEPVIRGWMLRGVARLSPRSGISFFEQGLKDPSPWVRLAAVSALGHLGTAQAASDLAGVLLAEANPGVRQSATYWLGHIGGSSAVAALKQELTSDQNPNVRVEAARALLRMATPAAKSALSAGRNDADPAVRQIAHGR